MSPELRELYDLFGVLWAALERQPPDAEEIVKARDAMGRQLVKDSYWLLPAAKRGQEEDTKRAASGDPRQP